MIALYLRLTLNNKVIINTSSKLKFGLPKTGHKVHKTKRNEKRLIILKYTRCLSNLNS